MQEVTVYVTTMQAVRRTADNCRRLLALLDAFGVAVSVFRVESSETQAFVQDLLESQKSMDCRGRIKGSSVPEFELPLCFVGPVLVGTYDDVNEFNEDGVLPKMLRVAGYAGRFRAAAHAAIPVDVAALTTAAASVAAAAAAPPPPPPPPPAAAPSCCDGSNDVANYIETNDDDDDDEPPPPPPSSSTDDDDGGGGGGGWDSPDGSLYGDSFDESDGLPLPPLDEDDEDEPPPPPPPED